MTNLSKTGRRELLRKLAGSAAVAGLAAALPRSAQAETSAEADTSAAAGSATVRVILADGTSVQWLAVTDGGITVGGKTVISGKASGLNGAIVNAAIAAILAAGGPQLTKRQVTLFGGAS